MCKLAYDGLNVGVQKQYVKAFQDFKKLHKDKRNQQGKGLAYNCASTRMNIECQGN